MSKLAGESVKKILEDSWIDHQGTEYPLSLESSTNKFMRRAFLAGAKTVFAIVEGIGDSDVSEADGVAIMEALKGELK